MWVVGKREVQSTILYLDDVEVTSGTATIYYYRDNAGTIEYLDDDLSTWSSTFNDIAATHVANVGWQHELTVPASADGYTVSWVMTHSVQGDIASGEHYVTTTDVDDISVDNAAIAEAVWTYATRTLTSLSTVLDAQGYTAARAALLDNMDAAVSTRATPAQVKTQADQALADYDPPTRTEATADKDEIAAILNHATYGLSALNTDLDLILSRLGVTSDTGGSSTAGTAMAKLNAIQTRLQSGTLSIGLV